MTVEVIKSKSGLEDIEPFYVEQLLWGTKSIPKTSGYLGFVPDEGFYLKMVCAEKEPLRIYKNNQDPVYRDSAMEAFFQFGQDWGSEVYINFEVNANGALLAEYGSSKLARTYFAKEELEAFECSAEIEKESWGVELHIPLRVLDCIYGTLNMGTRSRFACNFYKISETEEIRHYASLFPIHSEKPDFHMPEYFGTAVIAADRV